MKKKVVGVCFLVFLCASLFAGGGQAASGTDSSGLTTIKGWGNNRTQTVYGGSILSMQDWYDGTIPSRTWQTFWAKWKSGGLNLI
jgi:hypothetical protein